MKNNINKIKFFFIPFILFLSFFLQGCATNNMDDFKDKSPKFSLLEFFDGNTIAYGIFEDRFGKLRREFRVNIKGTINNNTIILDEEFLYDDGEKATRIWEITKNYENGVEKYIGKADDIEGKAIGITSGNALSWAYDIFLNMRGSNIKVHFKDWIYQQDDDIAINRAYVSKFGINIGSVTLVFLRGKTAKNIGPLNLNKW